MFSGPLSFISRLNSHRKDFKWGVIDSILLFCCGWGEIDNVRCVIIEPEKVSLAKLS